MRCTNGHDNAPGMRFCGQCGQELETSADPAPSQDPAIADAVAGDEGAPDTALSVDDPLDPDKTSDKTTKSRKAWVIAAVVVLGIIIAGIAAASGTSDEDSSADSPAERSKNSGTPIERAAEGCGVEANVLDEGESISFDTEGSEDFSGDDLSDVTCVLAALEVPDRVVSMMDQTRALDGTLDASWDDYEAFWNYHPDSGMSLTVYVAK